MQVPSKLEDTEPSLVERINPNPQRISRKEKEEDNVTTLEDEKEGHFHRQPHLHTHQDHPHDTRSLWDSSAHENPYIQDWKYFSAHPLGRRLERESTHQHVASEVRAPHTKLIIGSL